MTENELKWLLIQSNKKLLKLVENVFRGLVKIVKQRTGKLYSEGWSSGILCSPL